MLTDARGRGVPQKAKHPALEVAAPRLSDPPDSLCYQLFLLAADFSDDLRRFAAGTLGPDTLRMGALEVAAAAFAVYIATVEGGPEDGC